MKSKAPWIAALTIIGLMLSVVFCCGFMLEVLPWQQSFPLVRYRLRSDGTTLLVEETDVGRKDVFERIPNRKDKSIPKLVESTTREGIAVLTVNNGEKSTNVKATSFTKQIWSTKNRTWYFLQEVQGERDLKNWIGTWDEAHGFRKMMEEPGAVMGLSLSLDQSSLVAYTVDPEHGDPFEVFVIPLRSGSTTKFAIPKWVENPLMVSPGRFLVRRHEGRTDDAQVVWWSPGQLDANVRSNDLRIGNHRVIDVCALNGEVWGILDQNGGVSVVRFDPALTKVAEDLGWDMR